MTKLIILQELTSGTNHKIDLPCVVGRSHEVNLRLCDRGVSHRHALILEMNDQIWIEDLGSTNGVYVNDRKIREKTRLNLGDFLQLGQTRLLVARAREDPGEHTVVVPKQKPE